MADGGGSGGGGSGSGGLGPMVPAATLARAATLPVKPAVRTPLVGRYVRLEPYDADAHAVGVSEVLCGSAACGHPAYDAWTLVWRYMRGFTGTDLSAAAIRAYLARIRDLPDAQLFAVVHVATGALIGALALLASRPTDLVVEVGSITFTPAFQATPANSEATLLLCEWAFRAGYRRMEWKCDALNARSRGAAGRLGFTFEGIFRQHMIVAGGHSRDTAWFSIIDPEWPAIHDRLSAWVASDAAAALYARRAAALAAMAAPATAAAPPST